MAGNGNQGGGGGGPKIPRNLRPDLEQINTLLQDISTKISSLHQMDDTFKLNVEVKNIDKFSKLESSMKRVSKINATLAKNLGARARTEMELNKTIDDTIKKLSKQGDVERELTKKVDELEKKKAKSRKLNKDDAKTLEESIKQKKDLGDSIKSNQRALEDEAEKLDQLDGKWTVFGKTLGNQVLGALDKVGIGLTTLAIDAVFFSLEKLKGGFLKVYDLMERTTKAVGEFNIGMGGTTAGLDATRKEAFKVEGQMRALTGGELGVGLKMWEETSQAIGFVGGDFDKMATKATLAGRALGIGGTAAGELTRTMSMLGDTSKDVNKDMVAVSDAANDAGVSVASFGKELSASQGFMASFGKAGKKAFLDAAAYAKKLGVSLHSLQRFTDMTDTFESTATAAAKMNSVFGTSINAMELMLEQDPSKRLEMVRNQFKQQGKTWESMSRQERKFFAQTMDLSEEEAAGVLNSNMTLEQFQKQQEKNKKKQVSDEQKIRDGLAKTSETLLNFGQSWDRVTMAIAKVIKPILKVFGLADDIDKKMSFGERMTKVFDKLVGFIDKIGNNPKVKDFIESIAKDLGSIFDIFTGDGKDSEKVIGEVVDGLGEGVAAVKELYKVGKQVVKTVFTRENLGYALSFFKWVADNIGTIVGGFVAVKAALGAVSVVQGLSGVVGLLTGTNGFMATLSAISPALGSAATALGTWTAGIAAAAAAGYAVGKGLEYLIESLKVGGKSVQDIMIDAAIAWKENLTLLFTDSWELIKSLLRSQISLISKDLIPDFLQKSEPSNQKYHSQSELFGLEGVNIKKNGLFGFGKENVGTPPAKVTGSPVTTPTAPNATPVATPVSPVGPQSAAPVQKQEPKNLAAERAKEKEKATKNGLTLVAGDVFLDGNLVGRHLLRGAGGA